MISHLIKLGTKAQRVKVPAPGHTNRELGVGVTQPTLSAKACVGPENRLHSVIHAETPHVLTICPVVTEQSLTERGLLVTYPKIKSPLLYGRTPVVWGAAVCLV